ncbi:unnamed protein product [Peniophora sp. CBMAI 1063]|nr:unnamed protein product [Peniophora sp. CBMAI 1063]
MSMSDPSEHESAWFPEITRRLVELNASTITGRQKGTGFESELDHEIHSLEHATIQLKRLRNAQRPLLRLPPEVLGAITEYLLDEWPAFERPREDDDEAIAEDSDVDVDDYVYQPKNTVKRLLLGWILLTHACHTLRELLLSRHAFWARIVTQSEKGRDTILARCGETPLDLTVDSPRFYALNLARQALEFIFKHLDRAHTIRVNTSAQDSVAFFDPAKLLQNSMPHLTSLYISLTHNFKRIPLLSPEVLELPTLDAPRLTRLQLTNFLLPFVPNGLVKLTLRFHHRFDSISTEYFLDVLHRSERLESLTVEHCLPLLPAAEPTSPPLLPRLQAANFTDAPRQVISAWLYIRAHRPSVCFVLELDEGFKRPSPDDPPVPAPLQGNIDGTIAGLSIHDRDHTYSYGCHDYWEDGIDGIEEYDLSFFASQEGATLRDWRYGRGDDMFRSGFKRRLTTSFKRATKTTPFAVMNVLTSVIDFSALTTLSLHTGALNPPTAQWIDVLRPMAQLHTMFLRSGTKSVTKALTPSPSDEPILPRLRLLWIHALVLIKGPTTESVPHDGLATYTRTFQARTKHGVPLQHLRIDRLQMEKEIG